MFEAFLIKSQALRPLTLLKRDSSRGIFLGNLRNFKEHHFYRTSPVTAFGGGGSCFDFTSRQRRHIRFRDEVFSNPRNASLNYHLAHSILIKQVFVYSKPGARRIDDVRLFKLIWCRDKFKQIRSKRKILYPKDTGRKLNVHKTFRRRPGRLLNALCTYNLCPVSTGYSCFGKCRCQEKSSTG